jgi:hypothetical protein
MLTPVELITLVAVIAFIWILLKPDVVVRWGRSLGKLAAEVKRGEREGQWAWRRKSSRRPAGSSRRS